MAPAMIVGQRADLADLDGPLFLERDRTPGVAYERGRIVCPETVWAM